MSHRKKNSKKAKQQRRANKKNSGLGQLLRNKYGGKPDRINQAQGRVKRKDHVIDPFASNPINSGTANSNKLMSVTEVSNLQEWVDTMNEQKELENALRQQDETRIISHDPFELEEQKERRAHQILEESELFNYRNLPIPRKPKWDKQTTKEQLLTMQKTVFVNWRRGLAHTAKESNLEMTPFEKNIEVWKQLWRVVERANVLILIVDARNPLAFISRDLFKYVKEVGSEKRCILMINKADYLSALQRQFWREYFNKQNFQILYFSAMREQIRLDLLTKSNRDKLSNQQCNKVIDNVDNKGSINTDTVMNVDQLMDIFTSIRQEMELSKIEVGMIGYPNVGKSSVINVLMGAKKVSVGSTPGKTKHFQTLNLTADITLCDCPGLVFPTLVSSKSDMILNGVIPIDNLRDFITPSRLMVHRLSVKQLNDVYNLKLPTNKKRVKLITVYDILDSFCHQKKFYNACNVPRRAEAARIMLKDYVKGKTVYCHHPPSLTNKQKYLFYHGNILWMNKEKNDGVNEQSLNVLDQSKLNGDYVEMEEEEYESESDNVEIDEDEIGDEEFLDLWKHPLEEYGGTLGTSKKKHEKKASVLRRIEKKQSKGNRRFRRDTDNFQNGSNAVVVSAVPSITAKHQPVLL